MLKRQRVFVLTDETVADLHLETLHACLSDAGISVETKALPAGEQTKSLIQLEAVLDWLLVGGADRSDVLIALGGGVIGDLAGLAASLMKRGMNFVQIPTTLLAQVDSSVGGKTAINSAHGKNLIGAFYQPQLVIADIDLLKTLPARQIRAGYAEIVKYGLINDAAFFEWLEANGQDVLALDDVALAHAVGHSCAAKADIVAQDEREGGVRALLNLGHTFGHALEAANNYGPELLHGEAVACGMALALAYSQRTGQMDGQEVTRALAHMKAAGFVIDISALAGGPYEADALVTAMMQDKKARGGQVPLILARGLGKSYVQPDADLDDVSNFLAEMTK
jgi:3-dehydroquinate synthase